jgi:hypothetical protein
MGEIRDESKINTIDEKRALRTWRKANRSYQKYIEHKNVFNHIRLNYYKVINHIFLKWKLGLQIAVGAKIGGGYV